MTENEQSRGVTTVSDEGVRVERTLVVRDEGVVGTVRLDAQRPEPVVVTVVDPFPADIAVEEAGFRRDAAPDDGSVDGERARIRTLVEDESVEVSYGVALSEPTDGEAFSGPRVEAVEPVSVTGPEVTGSDTADGDSGLLSRVQRRLTGSNEDDGPASARTDGVTPDASTENVVDVVAEEMAEDATVEEAEAGPAAERMDRAPTAPEASADTATEGAETEPTVGQTGADAAPGRDGEWDEMADGDWEPAERGQAPSTTADAADGEGDSAPMEHEQAETTDGSDGTEPTTAASTPRTGVIEDERRSVELRVDRLSARIEEFAAYADGLADIIDEHGSATEFVDRFDEEVDDLERRLSSLDETVDALDEETSAEIDDVQASVRSVKRRIGDARERIRDDLETVETDLGSVEGDVEVVAERVDRVEGQFDTLDTDLGRVDGRVDEVAETVESETARLDGRLDSLAEDVESLRATATTVESDLASVREEVSAMRSEQDALREAVAELQSFRTSMADVFAADLGGETGSISESESDRADSGDASAD
jgi:predicted  nucleic acid-binding Zn-ribbon protein